MRFLFHSIKPDNYSVIGIKRAIDSVLSGAVGWLSYYAPLPAYTNRREAGSNQPDFRQFKKKK